MDRPRPHSFQVIGLSAALLIGGFFCGARLAEAVFLCGGKSSQRVTGNSIMLKRAQAIRACQKSGERAYSFDVPGFYPVLGSQ
jgi:hypothetical protein